MNRAAQRELKFRYCQVTDYKGKNIEVAAAIHGRPIILCLMIKRQTIRAADAAIGDAIQAE